LLHFCADGNISIVSPEKLCLYKFTKRIERRPLMTPSMLTSTLLKTALPAAVVVVRVVVVVGNAP